MSLRQLATFLCAGVAISGATWAGDSETAPADAVASAHTVTLAEAVRAARAHQPALALARGNLVTGVGLADQARAALLPQLNASASYTRATDNFVFQPGGTTLNSNGKLLPAPSTDTSPLLRYGLSASQLVYDFGETVNRYKAARVAADALGESVHVTEAQIDYNARVAFFTARAAKDMVVVARDTIANQEKHLGQVKGYVAAGTHPEIDLTQARADRATAQLQLINAENSYAVARAILNQAMGVERSIDYDLSDEDYPAVEGEEGAVEKLVDEAKRLRPEMANLRLSAKSQELTLRSAHDMYWPQLALSGSANESGPYFADHLTYNFSGMIVLTVPIIQGGAINAQIRQAEGQLAQAHAQIETQKQQVHLDVEQARLGIRAAKGAIAASEDALANTRDRLRLAEGRYTAGVGSMIELGDAQVALTTAAAQRVQVQYQLYTARAQLIKALGRKD